MGKTPTTVNGVATGIDSVIKAGGGILVSVVETAIIADVPWLGLPVIKQIWEALFSWICGYFIRAAEDGATFAVIDIQTGSEVSGVSSALAALVAAEKTGDASAIKKAIQDYANAQSSLVHSDGSAPAQ